MNSLRPLLLIILVSLCGAGFGEKADSLKTWTLPTVRVIVNSPAEAIGQLIRVPDPSAASSTIQDALQNLPGISSTTGSKDESNIRLRGFRKNEVKIMVDGRPLNNGYFGNVDLSKLAAVDIEEIQIVKGPASPMFGTNSMGGIVNIITKTPGTKSWLNLETVVRRNNSQDYMVSSSHSFNDFNYKLAAAWQRTDGFALSKSFEPTDFETGGIRDNSSGDKLNLNGNLNWLPDGVNQLGFSFNLSSMKDKDIPSSIYERKRRRYDNWLRYNAGLSAEWMLGETTQFTALLARDTAQDRYLEFGSQDILSLDSEMKTDCYSLAGKLKLRLNQDRSCNFGYRGELLFSKRKDDDFYQEWTDNRSQVHSAFVQYASPLFNHIKTQVGIGLAISANSDTSKLNILPEPVLGLEYEGSDGSISKLSLGLSSAQPTLRQLFSASKGNPGLKPQSAFKSELGHVRPILGRKLSFTTTAFFNRTKNLIDLNQGRYDNIYKVDSYGAEAELVFTASKRYQASLSYAWMDYLQQSDYRLSETAPQTIELSHTLALPQKARLSLSTLYMDSRLSQDDSGNYHILPSYWKHDASISLPYRSLNLELGIDNILDENYQGEYGFPEPGRNFYLGLKLSL